MNDDITLASIRQILTLIIAKEYNITLNLMIKQRLRIIPPSIYEEVREHLKQRIRSNWSFPVVALHRKDSKLRMCDISEEYKNRTTLLIV